MSKKNNAVSDFEWQSAAAYFRYVEVNARLADYSLTSVYSFHVAKKTGFKGLVARKLALSRILRQNLVNIELWVRQSADKISVHQLVFVRSLYRTTKDLVAIVDDQVERAERLAKYEKDVTPYIDQNEDAQDEFPF